AHPDLHSFPTRRSSDLVPPIKTATRPNSAGFRIRLLIQSLLVDSSPTIRTSGIKQWPYLCSTVDWTNRIRASISAALAEPVLMRSEEHTSELQSRENLV